MTSVIVLAAGSAIVALIAAVALLVLTVRQLLLRGLGRLALVSDRVFTYQCALLSILFANVLTFTVATQIYGDNFKFCCWARWADSFCGFTGLGCLLLCSDRNRPSCRGRSSGRRRMTRMARPAWPEGGR